jgi:hypothetical protein
MPVRLANGVRRELENFLLDFLFTHFEWHLHFLYLLLITQVISLTSPFPQVQIFSLMHFYS